MLNTLLLEILIFGVFFVVLFSIGNLAHAAAVISSQSDGSLSVAVHTSCNNGCSNITVASQVFAPLVSAHLSSIKVYTSDFRTDSSNPGSNTCYITLYDNDTNTLLATSDDWHNGSACGNDPQFSFVLTQPLLQIGAHYRWEFVFGLQNFSGVTFYGSPNNTVDGLFSASPIVNAKFMMLASIPGPQFLNQLQADGVTPIPEGAVVHASSTVFTASFQSAFSEILQLQVEIRPAGVAFTGEFDGGISTSTFVASGVATTIIKTNPDGLWHWRARFADADGNYSPWVEFGSVGNTDFIVKTVEITDPTIIAIQSDGSLSTAVRTSCDNSCSNITIASQGFASLITAHLNSLQVFTSDFRTSSANPGTNTCYINVYNNDTNALLATSDTWVNGAGCGANPEFSFELSNPSLQAGTHYRWEFVFGLQNFSGVTFYGSPNNTVDGLFSASPIVNAKFVARSSVFPLTLGSLRQYASGSLDIAEGGTIMKHALTFSGIPQSSSIGLLELQFEIKSYGTAFTNIPNATSGPVNSGAVASAVVSGLGADSYHWQARARDMVTNEVSVWQEFGTQGNADFVIETLGDAAARLAKTLINSTYLYGGKGWDYNLSSFVAPDAVKTGYSFWDQSVSHVAIGAGVDCSGLVMWAYNRSFDPNKSPLENFVKAESADAQYRYNTVPVAEADLKPGDVLFFDNSEPKDGRIDHVALYVGDNGSYDVVSAANIDLGIVARFKDDLKVVSTGFVAFKRVSPVTSLAMLVSAHSPVNLVVTDPDGVTITPTTTIASQEEYLREIPGNLYYSEIERSTDGNPVDRVYSYVSKAGDYTIKVLPIPGTLPSATYTIDMSFGGQSPIVLANNNLISGIPSDGYGVTVSNTGAPHSFIPVSIDIGSRDILKHLELSSEATIPLTIFGSNALDVQQINSASTTLAGAPIALRNTKNIDASYKDINKDGLTDLVAHVRISELRVESGDTRIELDGRLFDGREIKGFDSIQIKTKDLKKHGFE